MKKTLIFSIVFFLCFAVLWPYNYSQAVTFDPNFIISDEEMLDSTSLDQSEIRQFLKRKNSYLANYSTKDAYGTYRSAAEIIYNAANNFDCEDTDINDTASNEQKEKYCKKVTINPKLLLVLLQKEMSLIEDSSPTQRQLDWALGYGCPDGQTCNNRWRGFGKQINSAALQFFNYLENPHSYTYQAGRSYVVTNTAHPPSVIQPINGATAALYNYTPHVYWGNFNFFKLWMKYFTVTYPNGTLLQAKGEPGVWLIQNGKKRAFMSRGALTSRFDINKIVPVNKSVLDKYTTGSPIKFPQYSLIRSPRGTVFLLVDDKRRGFASSEAFRKIGYNPEEIINADWDDINTYIEGPSITATSSYPTGALLQDSSTGGVFWVSEGTKAPLWDPILLKTKYRWKSITPVPPEKLASYKTVEPAIFNDGELLKSSISPGVYVIDNKKRRAITSGDVFEELGYRWNNIITVPTRILELYEEGEPISEIYSEEEIEIQELCFTFGTSSPECLNATSTNLLASSTLNNLSGTTSKSTSTDDISLKEEIDDILNP